MNQWWIVAGLVIAIVSVAMAPGFRRWWRRNSFTPDPEDDGDWRDD